jgi:hypothetical protein
LADIEGTRSQGTTNHPSPIGKGGCTTPLKRQIFEATDFDEAEDFNEDPLKETPAKCPRRRDDQVL